MRHRLVALGLLAGLLLVLVPGTAQARVTAGGCDGWVEIPDENGAKQRYTPANDTPSTAIPIPDRDGVIIEYRGDTPWGNENHSGAVYLHVAGLKIKIDDWAGDDKDTMHKQDMYELDDAKDVIEDFVPLDFLTGVYKVSATHKADAGNCAGFAMVKIGGSPAGTVVGWIVITVIVITAFGVFRAGRAIPIVRRNP